jgi:hypothetical protein
LPSQRAHLGEYLARQIEKNPLKVPTHLTYSFEFILNDLKKRKD